MFHDPSETLAQALILLWLHRMVSEVLGITEVG